MTRFYIAPDADNEPTLWQVDADHPIDRPLALCRRVDTRETAWEFIEAGVRLKNLLDGGAA